MKYFACGPYQEIPILKGVDVYEHEKWLVFVVFSHTGFYQRIYSKAFDFSNPKALDKESKTGFNATFI